MNNYDNTTLREALEDRIDDAADDGDRDEYGYEGSYEAGGYERGESRAQAIVHAGRRAGERIGEIVRERPMVAVGAATLLGVLVGGLVLRKPARLLFIAAAGFVATELWRREGKIDVRGLIDRFTGEGESSRS